jgi:hypothetical protein
LAGKPPAQTIGNIAIAVYLAYRTIKAIQWHCQEENRYNLITSLLDHGLINIEPFSKSTSKQGDPSGQDEGL